jgi:hypothetical protein
MTISLNLSRSIVLIQDAFRAFPKGMVYHHTVFLSKEVKSRSPLKHLNTFRILTRINLLRAKVISNAFDSEGTNVRMFFLTSVLRDLIFSVILKILFFTCVCRIEIFLGFLNLKVLFEDFFFIVVLATGFEKPFAFANNSYTLGTR